MPSPVLIGSVFLTCVLGTLIAMLAMGLEGLPALWIWLYNVGVFIVIDIFKVVFKKVIRDSPGDTIDSDELVQVGKPKPEAVKHVEKQLRNTVHRGAARSVRNLSHNVEIVEEGSDTFSKVFNAFTRLGPETRASDGFIYKPHGVQRTSMALCNTTEV